MKLDYGNLEQAAVVDSVLEELQSDDKWDMSVGVERGYAKAGLKRYMLDFYKMGLQTVEGIESFSERFESSTDKSAKSMLEDNPRQTCEIKIENESHRTLMAGVVVLKSGRTKIIKEIPLLKKLKSQLNTILTDAGSCANLFLCVQRPWQ